MNRSLQTILPAVAVALAVLLMLVEFASAQQTGYPQPSFAGLGLAPETGAPAPRFPASPLAGGYSAAQGGAFMDAHGNPIVMPASYSPPYGYGESCPSGNCNETMPIEFGGYGADQIGPHYFDVSADVVYLRPENSFSDVASFSSVGVGAAAPKFLDPTGQAENYDPGWRIAARLDLGPLSLIEATYMGLYDFGFTQQVRSVDVAPGGLDNQLFSIFDNFGLGVQIPEISQGSAHRLDYESDLQSTEISYRHYWVGVNPRITGTYLLGFRYLRMTEDLVFSSQALGGTANINWRSENDLLGFQLGGDGWLGLRQGLRVGLEGKAGVYNNRFKFNNTGNFSGATTDYTVPYEGNQIAFIAEGGASVVADILPSISIRGGYQVLYASSLVTVGDNIGSTLPSSSAPPALATQGDALYHGFHAGIEYVW